MKRLSRIRRVYADEGMPGLVSRALRKMFRSWERELRAQWERELGERLERERLERERSERERLEREESERERLERQRLEHERLGHERLERERLEYGQLVREFAARTASLDVPGLKRFYWYHTVDLGNGLVTPGQYDFRDCLSAFRFPDDMSGMTVLDVGSATGFFAFECEKRGADVVAVELPSLGEWDMVPEEKNRVLKVIADHHRAETAEEAYYLHLAGPFDFCHRQLGSSVRRCFSTVYKLCPAVLGRSAFDWVILGDILVHLMSPFEALKVVAPLCRGTVVVTADVMGVVEELPLACFFGEMSRKTDQRSWWGFNRKCITDMFNRLGFDDVSVVGKYSGIIRPAWVPFDRWVFHARRGAGPREGRPTRPYAARVL